MKDWILSGFGDEIADPLEEQLLVMRHQDIRHIELRGIDGRNIAQFTDEDAPELLARLQAQAFSVSALGTPLGKIGIEEPVAPHMEMLERMLDLAQALECPYIRVFSFFMPEGDDPAIHRGEVLKRMEGFAKMAQGRKVRLVHENEKHIYGDTPERCLDMLEAMKGGIAATYDPSNFVQCSVDNKRAFPMMQPFVEYMHIKDSVYTEADLGRDQGFEKIGDAHRPAGEGDGNVLWILHELKRSAFKGFFSIEPHLTDYAGVPGSGADKFSAACDAFRGLLAQL